MTNPALDQVFAIATKQHAAGDLSSAARIYAQILEIDPSYGEALKAYGVLLCQVGEFRSGSEILAHAVEVLPNDAESWSNLGNALRILEDHERAISACRRAIELDPEHKFALNNLSAVLRQAGEIGESITAAKRALSTDPDFADAAINLASGHQAAGEIDEAMAILQDALTRSPENALLRDNLLFTSLYSDSLSDEAITQMHRRPGPQTLGLPKHGELRRIGWISGDLRSHPVGKFLIPIFESMSGLELYVYANQPFDDEVTAKLRMKATGWRNVYGQPAETVAEMVKSDGVDILIDLAGHSGLNRLDVFRCRAAPVQATFLGYSATTGEVEMDFILADDVLIPPDCEELVTERVVRMPPPFLTAKPVALPVKTSAGQARFASFNNPAKMSPSCLRAWAEILIRLPESTLTLKYKFFESEYVRRRFQKSFEALGVGPGRVTFLGHDSLADHEARFGTIDVALDTFPYTGATTTMDALARGVPTVALAGRRYVSRMSASLLVALGVSELVTSSAEDYINLAVRLGRSPEDRGRLSAKIAEEFPRSRLVDGAAQARGLVAALRSMWNEKN